MAACLAVIAAGPAAAQAPPRGGAAEPPSVKRVDINTASLAELKAVPGIGEQYAQKIIEARPFSGTSALMTKGVMSQAAYDRIAQRITASRVSGTAQAPRTPIKSERDMAALAAKQHPGEKWGYLKIHTNRSDTVGTTVIVKVPDSTPDGALVELAVGHIGRERDSLWKKVRGHVRRGQWKDGLDAFEVTAVWHVANPALARARPDENQEFANEGWRTMRERVGLTH